MISGVAYCKTSAKLHAGCAFFVASQRFAATHLKWHRSNILTHSRTDNLALRDLQNRVKKETGKKKNPSPRSQASQEICAVDRGRLGLPKCVLALGNSLNTHTRRGDGSMVRVPI